MQINNATMTLIRSFEGLRLQAYRDRRGIWTIDYDHTSRAGPPKVRPGMCITKREAEEAPRDDLKAFLTFRGYDLVQRNPG